MIRFFAAVLGCALFYSPLVLVNRNPRLSRSRRPTKIFGYRDPRAELKAEKIFLAVPDPQLAKEHLADS